MTNAITDPSHIDTRYESRSISFENLTGARSSGGQTGNGRKGSPSRILRPGEVLLLADIKDAGTIRHIWMTLDRWSPPEMRALSIELFYGDMDLPSISCPLLDFFGLPHGRLAAYYSQLVSCSEGRGLNSYVPIPFRNGVRLKVTNGSTRHVRLFFQIDFTLQPIESVARSYLHIAFNRENPTTVK